MIQLPNALIIVGTNRNAGKTTLACDLIERFSKSDRIIAVKISPHFHELEKSDLVIEKNKDFVIVKETEPGSVKDSKRMLRAGAAEVYYIQVWDRNIEKAFMRLMDHVDIKQPMICESGWLRTVVEPGLFLILNRKGNADMKESVKEYREHPHIWVEFDGREFDLEEGRIRLENGEWK